MEKGTPSPMGVGKKTKRTRAQMAPDVEMEQTEQQTGMATPVPSTSKGSNKGEESERMTRNTSFVEYDEVWGFDDPPLGFPGYALHLKAYTDREKGIPSQIEEKDLPAFFERMRLRSISRRLRGIPE
jgi:hypothetical protein